MQWGSSLASGHTAWASHGYKSVRFAAAALGSEALRVHGLSAKAYIRCCLLFACFVCILVCGINTSRILAYRIPYANCPLGISEVFICAVMIGYWLKIISTGNMCHLHPEYRTMYCWYDLRELTVVGNTRYINNNISNCKDTIVKIVLYGNVSGT